MLDHVPFWILGAAALIDTVLLFALLERHNWRAVTVWMLLLAVGVWLWHAGVFVRQLTDASVGPLADPVRWVAMCGMAAGLLLMPSAALHGTCRLLRHSQFQLSPQPDWRLAVCYLPLFCLIPMARSLSVAPSHQFLQLLADYRIMYLAWLWMVSGLSAYTLVRTARQHLEAPARRFYLWVAGSLLLIAILATLLIVALNRNWPETIWLETLAGLSPLLPAVLFAYFVMRFQLLPLVMERTLVYGVVLVGALLFHQIVLRDLLADIGDRYRLDVGIVEGMLVLLLILLYQPLRTRVAEALERLIDSGNERRRERQRLAVQLAARSGDAPAQSLEWFTRTMPRSFGSELGAGWLLDPSGRMLEQAGQSQLLDEQHVHAMLLNLPAGEAFATRYSAASPTVVQFLDQSRAGGLLWFKHDDLWGLFLVGCRAWGQPPGDEDLHAMSLLVEQFGVLLHNARLQAVQRAAEHRFLQQEKLSTLGLVASSLAHEIKNPLSSIKTIAKVVREELGPDSRHAEDLQMICSEVERLSVSTSELLEAARPPRNGHSPVGLTDLLSPTLRLLRHLARERQAKLEVNLPSEPVPVMFDAVGLREILFNLVSNGLDAAGAGGRVCVVCKQTNSALELDVHDTGPGFTPEQQALIFEPFYTTKSHGTGLGLYVVSRRVRELGGRMECRCEPAHGTTFSVRLPLD